MADKQFHEYHRDTQTLTVHMLHRAEDDKGDPNQRAGMAKLIQEIIDLRVAEETERCAKKVDHILREGGGTYGDWIRGPNAIMIRRG